MCSRQKQYEREAERILVFAFVQANIIGYKVQRIIIATSVFISLSISYIENTARFPYFETDVFLQKGNILEIAGKIFFLSFLENWQVSIDLRNLFRSDRLNTYTQSVRMPIKNNAICRTGAFSSDPKGVVAKLFRSLPSKPSQYQTVPMVLACILYDKDMIWWRCTKD